MLKRIQKTTRLSRAIVISIFPIILLLSLLVATTNAAVPSQELEEKKNMESYLPPTSTRQFSNQQHRQRLDIWKHEWEYVINPTAAFSTTTPRRNTNLPNRNLQGMRMINMTMRRRMNTRMRKKMARNMRKRRMMRNNNNNNNGSGNNNNNNNNNGSGNNNNDGNNNNNNNSNNNNGSGNDECNSKIIEFTTTIEVDFVGEPDLLEDEEIEILEEDFMDVYNEIQEDGDSSSSGSCDGYFRKIKQVRLSNETDRRQRRRRLDDEDSYYGWTYSVVAECRNCPVTSSGSFYVFDDYVRRRLLPTSTATKELEKKNARKVQEVCACPDGSIPINDDGSIRGGAPTERQFLEQYNEVIDEELKDGNLFNIEGVSDLITSTEDDFIYSTKEDPEVQSVDFYLEFIWQTIEAYQRPTEQEREEMYGATDEYFLPLFQEVQDAEEDAEIIGFKSFYRSDESNGERDISFLTVFNVKYEPGGLIPEKNQIRAQFQGIFDENNEDYIANLITPLGRPWQDLERVILRDPIRRPPPGGEQPPPPPGGGGPGGGMMRRKR